jgi:hypothetical protein
VRRVLRDVWGRDAIRTFLELFALAGLAITEPILSAFGDSPETFVFHGSDRADIIWFAVLVAFVPALVLWAIEQGLRLINPVAGRVAHLVFAGGLIALLCIRIGRQQDLLSGPALAVVAVLVGVAAVLAFHRFTAARQWLAIMCVAPIAFIGLFLLSSPASALLRSQDVAAAEVTVREPRSVIMIVWDEWPVNSIIGADGRIDERLFPNLAALANDGVWFRNATTVANATTSAVPALLSGRDPVDGLAPVASDHPENLFTLLADRMDLEVKESVTALCPRSFCDDPFVDSPAASHRKESPTVTSRATGLHAILDDAKALYRSMISVDGEVDGPQGFVEETSTRSTSTTRPQQTSAAVNEAAGQSDRNRGFPVLELAGFEGLLESIERNEKPTLHYLHLQFPHSPYRFLPDGRVYSNTAFGFADILGDRAPDPYDADAARQRLVLQVGYLDTLVGRLVKRLRATGLYDESIVTITSDHGAGFVPGKPNRSLGSEVAPELYPDLLYVPLIMKAPGLTEGETRDDNVMSIDVLPTLADLLGVDLPWQVDGRSLLGQERRSPEKHFFPVREGGPGPGGGFGGPADLGDRTRFDGEEYLARNLDRHLDTLFRGSNAEHRVFDIADGGDLVGTQITEIGTTGAGAETVTIDRLSTLRTGGDQAVVPVHVVGRVEPVRDGLTVAVVIDGVVAGVGPVFDDGARPGTIDIMLDPALVSAGGHEVQVYSVVGRRGAWRLAPLRLDES